MACSSCNMFKPNTRLLYTEKGDRGEELMTLDSYNEEKQLWEEAIISRDNPIYERLKAVYMNTTVDYTNLKNLKKRC